MEVSTKGFCLARFSKCVSPAYYDASTSTTRGNPTDFVLPIMIRTKTILGRTTRGNSLQSSSDEAMQKCRNSFTKQNLVPETIYTGKMRKTLSKNGPGGSRRRSTRYYNAHRISMAVRLSTTSTDNDRITTKSIIKCLWYIQRRFPSRL